MPDTSSSSVSCYSRAVLHAALPVIVILLLFLQSANAQVRLPGIFANGMVIQRDAVFPVWGWARAGENITINFRNKTYRTKTNADGKWKIQLPAVKAGGPFSLEIKAGNTIRVEDILAGDVFVCSGQSNMVIPMERVKERYDSVMKESHYPAIRQYYVAPSADLNKVHDDSEGKWTAATDSTLPGFSAVAFFFARDIHQRHHVPIGIINVSVGGSPIEAWLPAAALTPYPSLTDTINKYSDTALVGSRNREAAFFNKIFFPTESTDAGLNGPLPWFHPDLDDSDWNGYQVPGFWSDQGVGNLNGVAWFRKEITIPVSASGQPARLFVGRIVDADEVYVNGVFVGRTTYQYPPRRYTVPAGLLKPGKNLISVRIINTEGRGGFVPDKNYSLEFAQSKIDLRGEWKWKVGQVFPNVRPARQISIQNYPTALFNTMIAPHTQLSIKGVLWYQGEANTGNAAQYHSLLTSLINSWRTAWRNDKLPFLLVQLPGFMEQQFHPSESSWAALRQAQLQASAIPHTGMAVTIDLGEWNDIHPLNKRDVGKRLALLARKIIYHEEIVAEGPQLLSATKKDQGLVLKFGNATDGLQARRPMTYCFELAGADKKFVWAEVVIRDSEVILTAPSITDPRYARYAWSNNPAGCNLTNKEGLLASPFFTQAH